jgi:hypothetical protein
MRVFNHCCNATNGRRARARNKILAAGIARILKVHVAVDHARKHKEPRTVATLPAFQALAGDSGHDTVLDVEIALTSTAATNDRTALET